jgi:hypothetical protein
MDRPDQSLALDLWNPLFAGLTNLTNPAGAPRSNLGLGLGGLADAAIAASGVGCVVACPALPGDVITRVSVFCGGTAETVGTHLWAAIYAGMPTAAGAVLLDKSSDFTAAGALGASGRFDFTGFAGVPLIPTTSTSPSTVPQNFVYVMIAGVYTAVATVLSMATPAAINYQWTPQAPVVIAGTAGAGLTNPASAPATLTGLAAPGRTNAPIVVLT